MYPHDEVLQKTIIRNPEIIKAEKSPEKEDEGSLKRKRGKSVKPKKDHLKDLSVKR
jgi:peptide deformylase